MDNNQKNRLPSWAGVVITVVIAVGASLGTYAARMYQVEKEIEIMKMKVNDLASTQVKTTNLLEQINERTIRIEEGMKMKADKIWEK